MSISEVKLLYVTSKFGKDYHVANQEKGEITYHCPFCPSFGKRNNDRKLYVNVNKLVWECKRCGSKGALEYNSAKEFYDIDVISDIIDWMDPKSFNKLRSSDEEPTDFFPIPKFKIVDYKDSVPYQYMLSRGFSNDDMVRYDMRISGIDEFIGRVVIPNKVISNNWTDMYTARSYIGHPNKYKNPVNSKKSMLLFNYENIPDNPEYMILNEGMLNSIVAGEYSVASFGKSLSSHQRDMIISKNPKHLYISYDYDARDKSMRICDDILSRSSIIVHFVELPEDIDAVDLGKNKYHELVMSTPPFPGSRIYKIFGGVI